MHRFAANLPDDYEYAIIWWGQSNATPQGTMVDGFAELPELELRAAGMDVTVAITGTPAVGVYQGYLLSETLADGAWIGAMLRIGRPDSPGVGYAKVEANAGNAVYVRWEKVPTSIGTKDAYLVFEDGRHRRYPTVRVMTPFLPPWSPTEFEDSGEYPPLPYGLPGVAFTVDSAEKAAMFLNFTFCEGINGWGYSEANGAATASSSAIVVAGAPMTAGVLAGGYLIVYHALGYSWARIADNTTDTITLTVDGWSGVAYSAGWVGVTAWTAWVGHYDDNPAAFSPHEGFLYPSNQQSTAAYVGTRCRPRGRLNRAWGSTGLGAMLPTAWLLSSKLGKRINVIPLGMPGAGILPTGDYFWPYYQIGWLSPGTRLDFNPGSTNGLFARLQTLIENAAAANAVDGNTKPLKVLAIFGFQGETEAMSDIGRASYKHLLPAFVNRLRELVFDAGLSPYSAADELPVVHAGLPSTPWESSGNDEDGEVNAAISDYTAKIKFGATFSTEDSEKASGDPQHFSGAGEVQNAKLAAAAAEQLIGDALAAHVDWSDSRIVEMCNVALAHIGQAAKLVDLSTDSSVNAQHCRRFYPQARDKLLARSCWSFASKREALAPIEDRNSSVYAYAYGKPDNCARVFAVLPPESGADHALSRARVTDDFTVELDDDGYPVVYTNQEDAVARYTVTTADTCQFPATFRGALSWVLAADLAGVIVKGEAGVKMSQWCLQMAEFELGSAKDGDGQQAGDMMPEVDASWIAARN